MDFIDVFSGEPDSKKLDFAKKLKIKIAPGDYSLLISKKKSEIRKKRRDVDFVAAIPKDRQELNHLLTDTHYDFFIINFRLGKRNVRMAKRQETYLALPVAPLFSQKISEFSKFQYNIEQVQKNNGQFLLCSGAEKPNELRSGYALSSIAVLFGAKPDLALKSVRDSPNFILQRNEARRKQEIWGVEIETH